MATPTPEPTPVVVGPACTTCGGAAVVNWLRRPTEAEIAEAIAVEEARRERVRLLADPQLPPPEFGPLPTGEGMTRTVYACAEHAIPLAAAALVHASSCTPANGVCACTPETPPPAPVDGSTRPSGRPLPANWTNRAPLGAKR
ncbi:hypothetical protein F3K32_42590 [Streptomyces sp. LBUM 1483]|uniref:hypothetical protein n=1 Tax=Streptomyces scabiei TaxID=1930 RepID=UPI001B330895|nr:hypothetical protein [Streptomyces sp. LBUM 1483]MBP5926698.1 hypothetical protein [Streptomyces sp. LBUM 1483]